VLFRSQSQNLVSAVQGLEDSYEIVQRASSSAAANAVSKLATRFAAGTDELAKFVRKDQDLTVESERLDKAIIAAVSKAPAERNAAAEDQIRNRIGNIKSERDSLQNIFNQRFPEYVALSKPPPLTIDQTQELLADDEALLDFDFGVKSYAWVITRTNADWNELAISAKGLSEQITQLRQSLTFDVDKSFDTSLAHEIYQETFGSLADKLQGKKRLSVVTNGALTSLPLQLLVTQDPSEKSLKDIDWLVRSYAITVLPSVYSLKTLRAQSAMSVAEKPIIAFADPSFSKQAHTEAKKQIAMRGITSFYSGTQIDIAALAERLPQLPGTRAEVQAIGNSLGARSGDIKLGLAATETAVKTAKLDQYRIVLLCNTRTCLGRRRTVLKGKSRTSISIDDPRQSD
jgi:CHAT domain